MDAVVHLAGEPSTRADWETVKTHNIEGTYNVMEAARQAGVKKVVFASTNHVMGMYDRDRQWPIYAQQPIRPDSLYGVSKAFGEALGRHYYDQFGLSVICLRIVWRAIKSDVGFGIFYAISGNGGRHWDITETMEKLGYRPQDDAEEYAEQLDALSREP
jgi:NAD+ dependent glucose-6-phosphate dehydrogenase